MTDFERIIRDKRKNKIEISQIEIKIGKSVLKLSIAQMQELKDVLNETFPEKETVYIPNPIYVDHSYHRPIYIERPVYPWREWEIICDSSSTTFQIEASPCQD